jgi:hypothetical protein
MEMLRYLWDVAVEQDSTARELDQARRFPLCNPQRLQALFELVGLTAIQVRPLEILTVFQSFDDYWTPLLSGHGCVSGYIMSLSAELRSVLRGRLRTALPTTDSGSIVLKARACAVRGITGDTT